MRVLRSIFVPISIHALREEGDQKHRNGKTDRSRDFYPRPPRGGRPGETRKIRRTQRFLSTPSARRATHLNAVCCCFFPISIHALREEGDPLSHRQVPGAAGYFYPRPPRGGRRGRGLDHQLVQQFLSTPSARRATQYCRYCSLAVLFLSTPSARRATTAPMVSTHGPAISIHALREEGDRRVSIMRMHNGISIHALREEGDSKNRDKISIFKQIIQHSARI